MDADISWYEDGQNHFKNQPSTSATQRGRPPDKEQKPNIKDDNIIIEAVCLIDDDDDAEQAVADFHNTTRKNCLLPFTGVEIQEELKFLEAIKQFKMILEEKVEVLTFRENLKEFLYKCLLFFGSNYGRIAILYKEQYLDVMEDILLYYCDTIKEFCRDQKRRDKKMRIIQEARRLKILLKHCMLNKMDRILHVLLKVRLAPEIAEMGIIWADVYVFFLTKVKFIHTEDDILRSFIAFQKFKTLRTKSEFAMIDKLMYSTYQRTTDELRRIPCLGEIMSKMKQDRLYGVRDMVTLYIRYYKEKVQRSERFEMDGFDEDTEESNINGLRHLDLSSSSFAPSIPSECITDSPTDRRRVARKTVWDLAAESIYQLDPCTNSEFALFDEDLTKREAVEDAIVVLDDEEDDDVIVVCHNLKTVITIDDDDDDEEPVQIQPTKSPPPRDALSPDTILHPPEVQVSNSSSEPVEIQPPVRAELSTAKSPYKSPSLDAMDMDNSLPIITPINMECRVPDAVLPPPKEAIVFSKSPIPPENFEVPKKLPETHRLTRQVKRVDNSLKITINAFPKKDNVPTLEVNNEKMENQLIPPEQSMETTSSLDEKRTHWQNSLPEREKTVHPVDKTQIVPPDTTASVTLTLDKEMEESSQHIQTTESGLEERLSPKASLISPRLDNIPSEKTLAEPHTSQANQPMEVQEIGNECNQVPNQSTLGDGLPPEKSSDSKEPANQSSKNEILNQVDDDDRSSNNNSGTSLESVANSTMNEEITRSTIASSLSPIVKQNFSSRSRTDPVENSSNDTMKAPTAIRRGVLPSSKVPSNLDDSPEKDTDKYALLPGPRTESETSNISSPSFESIDEVEAKKYFESRKHKGGGVSSSSSDTDTSSSSTSSNNTTSTSTYEPSRLHVTAESQASTSETTSNSDTSDTSSFEQSYEITHETTVIQVAPTNQSDYSKSQSTKSTEIKPLQTEKESLSQPSSTPTAVQIAASGVESCDLAQYSNITECFTKFTDELSVEDISTLNAEESESLALTTIDLVPSTENGENVIMVKCRPIEPLKDEENIVSGAETVTFSTDEVLAPSSEAIALLVTYPGSSQEESQHFLMCDANLALSDEQLAFSDDNMPPAINNTIAAIPDGQNVAKTSTDLNRSMPNPRRETIDELTLSGSQPYTPQSSPSTRIETVKPFIRFDDGSSALDPYLNCSATTAHPTFSPPRQETAVINKATHLKDGKGTPKPSEKVSKRRSSTDISPKPSKPRRKSYELSKDRVPLPVETKNSSMNCSTSRKITENVAEGFREDLSQSLTSARRVTPQEVDKITQLPLKYSQQLWTDRSQADLYKKQLNVDQPAATKVPQQTTSTTSEHKQQSAGDSLPISHNNITLSEKSSSQVPTAGTSLASKPQDKPISDVTGSSASFAEEKLNELYIKEYGNNLSPNGNNLSKTMQGTRRESREVRPVKIYAKEKSIKDSAQPTDRDMSLKSYKTLIKGVSKRRTSVLRDIETPLQKEEEGTFSQLFSSRNQPINEKAAATEDLLSSSQQPKDLSELFNNGIEGPVGKLMGAADVDNNFFWDSDNDASMEDTYSGTISVKPDSLLYQAKKQQGSVVVSSAQKNSTVPSLKSSRTKSSDSSSFELKSPEKKRCSVASDKPLMGLYVKLTRIDIASYQQDLKRKQMQASEIKKKLQRQQSLAKEMREKEQQSLHRDQILLQFYSRKSEPTKNWFLDAKAKLSRISPNATSSAHHSHVSSSRDTTKGKSKDQPVHRNGHKTQTEKRRNRDFEPGDEEVPKKKIALNAELADEKPETPIANGKVVIPKLKSIMKSVNKMSHRPAAVSSRTVAPKRTVIEEEEEEPSSPVKKTKSGRVCKKPRTDYDDVIKKKSGKVKKTVRFKL